MYRQDTETTDQPIQHRYALFVVDSKEKALELLNKSDKKLGLVSYLAINDNGNPIWKKEVTEKNSGRFQKLRKSRTFEKEIIESKIKYTHFRNGGLLQIEMFNKNMVPHSYSVMTVRNLCDMLK